MIKSIVLHDIPMDHVAAMERWYWRDHSPEVVRRFGPWETRHDSWLPVDAPPEARKFGFYNWRMTVGWWRDLPLPGPQGELSFTQPPVWPKVATCFVPAQPTDDFMGWEIQPGERNVLRWFILIHYPEGVSKEEGEQWFKQVHAPEVMRQPGLYRFFSYKVLDGPMPLPGTWSPSAHPPEGMVMPMWDRVIELWYDNFDDWRRSVIEQPPAYTKPVWATADAYPFLEPYRDFVSTFILERPTDEFHRDGRGYL